jgi:predicted lipoprotein with Yx(FWY)xxD motif
MQRAPLFAGTAFVALLLAACGGGGGGGSTPPAPVSTSAPSTAPSTAPATASPAPAAVPSSMPTTAAIAGVTVYVGTNNGHTLYHTTGDGNDVSNCTTANGCTTFWFPYTAPAGTVAPAGTSFTIFQRTDGTYQWAVSGHPLYEFYADTAAGQNNGNGFVDAYGTWSEATVSSSTTAPAPTPTSYGVIRP